MDEIEGIKISQLPEGTLGTGGYFVIARAGSNYKISEAVIVNFTSNTTTSLSSLNIRTGDLETRCTTIEGDITTLQGLLAQLEIDVNDTYLKLSGGTVTGRIKCNLTPEANEDLVNKQYVDFLITQNGLIETTDQVPEGINNLYFTYDRVMEIFQTLTTDNIPEGAINKYMNTATIVEYVLPILSAAYLPLTGGTVTGQVNEQDPNWTTGSNTSQKEIRDADGKVIYKMTQYGQHYFYGKGAAAVMKFYQKYDTVNDRVYCEFNTTRGNGWFELSNVSGTVKVRLDSNGVSTLQELTLDDNKLTDVKEIHLTNDITFTDEQKEAMPIATTFWDSENKTLTTKTGTDTFLQHGQEFVVPVKNNTLTTQLNGKVVRITGIDGIYKEVAYSDNSAENTAVFDGVLTQDIAPGEVGFMLLFGELNDYNTTGFAENDIIYMSTDGDIVNVEPVSPSYVRIIGKVGKVDTVGSIFVRYTDSKIGDITEANKAMNMPHGIPVSEKANVLLSYDDTTRKVTISGTFCFYAKTQKHIFNEPIELTAHADTTGTYFVMFDKYGVLKISSDIWVFGDDVPVAIIIYNNTASSTFWTGTKGILFCERHGCEMDKATHSELHSNIGCYATSGFSLAGYSVATGTGGLTANSYSIDTGFIYDEDNQNIIPALSDNEGVGNVYRIWYKLGSNWFWYDNNLPYLFVNNNILRNVITAGIGHLVEQSNQDVYMNMWLVGMPILDNTTGVTTTYGFGHIIGQNNYSTLALAQASNFFDLDLSGFPAQEIAPLYQIIYRRNNGYNDNGNCRIESVRRIVGTRFVNGTQATSPSIHNNLSGRSDANAHPDTAISNTPATVLTGTNQAINNTIINTYLDDMVAKSENLSDLENRQTAVNNLFDATNLALGQTLIKDEYGNMVAGNAGGASQDSIEFPVPTVYTYTGDYITKVIETITDGTIEKRLRYYISASPIVDGSPDIMEYKNSVTNFWSRATYNYTAGKLTSISTETIIDWTI